MTRFSHGGCPSIAAQRAARKQVAKMKRFLGRFHPGFRSATEDEFTSTELLALQRTSRNGDPAMNFTPEQSMLAVCLVTAALSMVFAMIERLHGLGPGSKRPFGTGGNAGN